MTYVPSTYRNEHKLSDGVHYRSLDNHLVDGNGILSFRLEHSPLKDSEDYGGAWCWEACGMGGVNLFVSGAKLCEAIRRIECLAG